MFGFRKPRAPLTTFQRVDIELLMRRSIETIGLSFVRDAEVVTELTQLSLDTKSPELLLESARSVIRDRLPVTDHPCDVVIVEGSESAHPSSYRVATESEPARIRITDETLGDPLRTLVELAYQYSSHYWHSKTESNELDLQPRTSHLLPLCCGLGVLASDASLYDNQWSQGGWTGWSISRSGYYSTVEIGYALALFARSRNELNGEWEKYLRLDSLATLKQAVRYFDANARQGGALLFDVEVIPSSATDQNQLAEWLRGDDRAFALAAAFALAKLDALSPKATEAAMIASKTGDPDLVPVAARLLGNSRQRSVEVDDRLRAMIRKESHQTVYAAVLSAEKIGLPMDVFSSKLGKLLDLFQQDASELLQLIGRQGNACQFLVPNICEQIVRSLRSLDHRAADEALRCLEEIESEPEAALKRQIRSPEICQEALERLATLD